jgi:hypothetical protein
MSCFRALLFWALILAVPFQGSTATSMAFCETEHAKAATATRADPHRYSRAVVPDTTPFNAVDDEVTAHHDNYSSSAYKSGTCGACHAVPLILDAPIVRAQYLPTADLAEPRTLPTSFAPSSSARPRS